MELPEPIQAVNLKQYWMSGGQRDNHFNDILEVGVLVLKNSLYNSPVWPMGKEDGLLAHGAFTQTGAHGKSP